MLELHYTVHSTWAWRGEQNISNVKSVVHIDLEQWTFESSRMSLSLLEIAYTFLYST
jgi:hypothetical protein